MLVYVLALVAAVLFALGSVVQQRVASEAPPEGALRLRLLWHLAHQPLWLVGVGTALVGNLCTASALSRGSVALVQPLLVARLLFALPLAAATMRRRIPRRDLLAALTTAAGLGLFLAAGRPSRSSGTTPALLTWVAALLAIGTLTGLIVRFARRLRADREALLLGIGAGLLFGLQAGLTEDVVTRLGDGGVGAVVTSWTTYAIPVVALTGTLLLQSAFQLAPLTASYPALSAAEPLAGIAVGLGVIGGGLRVSLPWLALEVLALLVMTAGILVLARSQLITGELDILVAEQDEGRAIVLEEQIARELDAVEHALADDRHPAHLGRLGKRLADLAPCFAELDGLRDEVHELQQAHPAPTLSRGAEELAERERQVALLDARLIEVDERAARLRGRFQGVEARLADLPAGR